MDFPRVDERLAPPETRLEYLHGGELFAAPADPPHATRHADLAFVLRATVAPGFTAAIDLLTRTADASDFAPDASIYPSALDAEGHRQLEEVAFEITSEQALSVPTVKARELIRRGVRRMFCVLVKQARVLEWSRETDGWQTLLEDSSIEDRTLVRPLVVRALLDVAASDEAVARAVLAKNHPVIETALAEGEARGEAHGNVIGRRAALIAILEARGMTPDGTASAQIDAADLATLDHWIRRAATASSLDEVFDAP